jgi:hypothetical protein
MELFNIPNKNDHNPIIYMYFNCHICYNIFITTVALEEINEYNWYKYKENTY